MRSMWWYHRKWTVNTSVTPYAPSPGTQLESWQKTWGCRMTIFYAPVRPLNLHFKKHFLRRKLGTQYAYSVIDTKWLTLRRAWNFVHNSRRLTNRNIQLMKSMWWYNIKWAVNTPVTPCAPSPDTRLGSWQKLQAVVGGFLKRLYVS